MKVLEDTVSAQRTIAESYMQQVLQIVKERDPNEVEFHQAVEEIFYTLIPVIAKNPRYIQASILERMVEPERTISFRVPWVTDDGNVKVNRGYRVQFNSA